MFKKFVSLFTAGTFLYSFIAAPCVQGAIDLAGVSRDTAQARAALSLSLPAYGLDISPANGRITDVRDFGSGPLVINIQDLHCHPEVQRNIAAILGQVERSFGKSPAQRRVRVHVEGGYGTVDTSWINGIKDPAVRARVMDALVNDGRLTGAELYSMSTGRSTMLAGLEDEKLHKANIVRLGRMLENKPRFEKELATLKAELGRMQARHFTGQNKRLSRIIEKYRAGKLSSGAYHSLLGKYIEKINRSPRSYNNVFSLNMDQYPNIKLHLALSELSKGMNYRQVSTQMQKFMQNLKGAMPFSEYNAFLEQTQNFKDMDRLYVSLAVSLSGAGNGKPWVAAAKRDLSRYGALQKFFAYVLINQKINPVQLVREDRLLVEELRTAFSRSVPELEVAFLVDFFDCFDEYLLNRLSAADYQYFQDRFAKFQSTWGKYTYKNRIKDLADAFPLLDAYYAANAQRNNVFMQAAAAPLAGSSRDVAVIVSGGFHTEGLTNLLVSKKISYVTITPNVTQDTTSAGKIYQRLAREQAQAFGSQALQLALGSYGAKVISVSATSAVIEIGNEKITLLREGDAFRLPAEGTPAVPGELRGNIEQALSSGIQHWTTLLGAQSSGVAPLVLQLAAGLAVNGSLRGWWGDTGLIWQIASNLELQQQLQKRHDINEIAQLPAFLQAAIADGARDLDTLAAFSNRSDQTPIFAAFLVAIESIPSLKSAVAALLQQITYAERLDQVRALPAFTRLAHVIGFTSMKGLDEAGYDVVSVLGHDRRVAKAARRAAVALNRDPDRTEFIALVHDMGVIPYTHLALAGGHMKGIISKLGIGADYFKKQSVEALRRGGIDIPEYLENDILNFDINKTDTVSDEAKIAVAVESVEGVIEDILFAIRFERFKPEAVPASIRALLGFNELPDLQAISQEAFDAFVIETTITALRLEAGKTPQEIAGLAKTIKVKARSELLSPLFDEINAPAVGDIDAKITAAHQTFSKNSPAATDEDFLKTLLGLSETDLTSISLAARPGVKGTPTLKALKARLQEIVAAGDVPIISTDIDDTLTPLGAVLTDDAVDALLAYIRAGGHIVFNSRTKTEWYYRRILEPLSARLGDRELHLLSQIHFIMRLGGEIYVASPRDEQGYIHYERVYNVSQNEGKGKGDGLQLFLNHFNQTVGRGQILGHLGDLFIHAGDGEDGSVLAVAGETKYPSLVAVDVGMHKGNIITQKGQSFLPSDIPGIAGALNIFAALGKELRGLSDNRTASARTPAQPVSIIQPFTTESRHVAVQEDERIIIEVQGPGFVWAGKKNAASGQWERTYLIPLRKTRTGTWQAPLPPSANVFTSYWTGGKDGTWEAGEWNAGGDFSVERTKEGPTSAVKPSTQERGKRWGWSDWAIRDILAPVVENFGMLLQPWKFGVQHTQYVPKQQRILTGLALTTAIAAALAGAGTAIAVALSFGMFLAGAGAGVLAWFATGAIIHAGWNIFSSLPAVMGVRQDGVQQDFKDRINRVLTLRAFNRLARISGFTLTQDLFEAGYDVSSIRSHDERVAEVARQIAVEMGRDSARAKFIGLVHDIGVPPFRHLALKGHYMKSVMSEVRGVRADYFKEKCVEALRRGGVDIPEELENDLLHFDVYTRKNISDEAKIAIASESITGVVEDIMFALRFEIITQDDILRFETLFAYLFGNNVQQDIPSGLRKYVSQNGLPKNLQGISNDEFNKLVIYITRQVLQTAETPDELKELAGRIKDLAREELLDPLVFTKINSPVVIAAINETIEKAHQKIRQHSPGSTDEEFVELLIQLTEPDLSNGKGIARFFESEPPSENLTSDELLTLLNSPVDPPDLVKKLRTRVNLGGTKIIFVPAEGSEYDEQRNLIVPNNRKAYEAVTRAIAEITSDTGIETFYLFGLNETSYLSRYVHGLDFERINAGMFPDLKKHLNEVREEYGIDPSWEILDARRAGQRVFMTVKTEESIFSIMIGYDVKRTQYNYRGKEVVHRERGGNPFSPRGMGAKKGLPQILSDKKVKNITDQIHDQGQRAIMDMYGWRSPDCITEENYRYFSHELISASDSRSDQQIFESFPHPGCVVHLKDGARALVHSREDANDQLFPDLGLKKSSSQWEREKYEFWKNIYLDELKHKIDVGADGVRWDLAADLKTDIVGKQSQGISTAGSMPHDLLWEVMSETIDYAMDNYGREFYFMPEVYSEDDRIMFRNMNLTLITQKKLAYVPVKTYYVDPMKALLEKNGKKFEECIQWLIMGKGKYFDAINLANFDDEALKDIIPNKILRDEYQAFLSWLGKAGFNTLSYVRDDLGVDDVNPVVGGARTQEGVYLTHRFTAPDDLVGRLEVPLDELLSRTEIHQTMKGSAEVSEVHFTDGIVTFDLVNGGKEVFDIRKMGTALGVSADTPLNPKHYHQSVRRPGWTAQSSDRDDAAVLPGNEGFVTRLATWRGATGFLINLANAGKEFGASMREALHQIFPSVGSSGFIDAHGEKNAGAKALVAATRRGLIAGAWVGAISGAALVVTSLLGALMLPVGGVIGLMGAAVLLTPLFAGSATNIIVHMQIDYVVTKDLVAAVKMYGNARLENGDVRYTVFVVNTPPANIDALGPEIIGTAENGKKVWAMATPDGQVVLYSEASSEEATRVITERLRQPDLGRGRMLNDVKLQERLRTLAVKAVHKRQDIDLSAKNTMTAAIEKAMMGTAVRIEAGATGKRMWYDADGTVVLAGDMPAALRQMRVASTGETVAMGANILLHVAATEGNIIKTVEALFALPGSHPVVVDTVDAAKNVQAALAKKSRRQIYAMLAAAESDVDARITEAFNAGIAGCVVRINGGMSVIDFATATPDNWRAVGVSVDRIDARNLEAGTIREMVRASSAQCHILDVSQLADMIATNRDIADKQALIDMLGARVLSLFSAHSYSPRFVRDAVYGFDADQLTNRTKAAYLDKMFADLVSLSDSQAAAHARFEPLKKAFNDAWVERLAAEQWISEHKYSFPISMRHRQMIGRALVRAGDTASEVTDNTPVDMTELNEAGIEKQYREAMENGHPVAISELITLLRLFDTQAMAIGEQQLMTQQDMQAVAALLGAA